MPSGNKPLPEPMLTKISVAIWRHKARISFKDEIQASDSENCILKQKVDMLGNNNRVQHNATQCCNQPSAHTIVH